MTDEQNGSPQGTIQIGTLTWADGLPALQALLCDGNEIGRNYAKTELRRMAEAADLATEVLDAVLAFLDTLDEDQQLTLPPLLHALLHRDRPGEGTGAVEPRGKTAMHDAVGAAPVVAAAVVPLQRFGELAKAEGQRLPLEVLYSAAGFYIGTCLDGLPYSRESVEYFARREAAEAALTNNSWTQRDKP